MLNSLLPVQLLGSVLSRLPTHDLSVADVQTIKILVQLIDDFGSGETCTIVNLGIYCIDTGIIASFSFIKGIEEAYGWEETPKMSVSSRMREN